jgi:cytochrome c-type biogenesis protein CcmH/NrfF
MSKHRLSLVAIVLVSLISGLALAQVVEGESLDDPATEAKAADIASRTMSPFCPGRTLADCPSGKATEWRQDIRALLKQGKSAAEVQKILNARAGENLTGTPESSLGWALPVGLCVGALAILTLVLRRLRAGDGDVKTTTTARVRDADDDEEDDDPAESNSQASRPKASKASKTKDDELEDRLRRELEAQDEADSGRGG